MHAGESGGFGRGGGKKKLHDGGKRRGIKSLGKVPQNLNHAHPTHQPTHPTHHTHSPHNHALARPPRPAGPSPCPAPRLLGRLGLLLLLLLLLLLFPTPLNPPTHRRTFASSTYDIKKVGVVGLGLMGHGIGLVSAQGGYEVVAVEAQPAALEAGKKRMQASLSKLLSKVRGGLGG